MTIFDATPSVLGQSNAYREAVLDRLDAIGVDAVRVLLPWRFMAPKPDNSQKPQGFDASDLSEYQDGPLAQVDDIVRGVRSRGMQVLMTPGPPIPDWASGSGHSDVFNPDPDEFRDFVTALGDRYSGNCAAPFCLGGLAGASASALPRVEMWSVWNEPNLKIFLRPQRLASGRTISGDIYRRLYLAAQRALQDTGHGRDPLLIGETSPSLGNHSTDPIAFLRQVLCLSPSYKRVRKCTPIGAQGWAQHPYNPFDPPWRKPTRKRILSIGSLGRMTRALRLAAEAGATGQRLPIYITEYGVESLPEDRYGVSLQRQAEFLGISEYLLYRNPWVDAYGQYLMTDDRHPRSPLSFQTGLRFSNDAPKPSYDGFPLSLVVRRQTGSDVQIWGHVRPAAGSLDVDVRYRNGEDQDSQLLETTETDSRGYFSVESVFRAGREWRATCRLPDGRLLKGPYVRSYRF